ncbi:MAG TPA: UbiA prenyltransferase family protein [Streptosporangiaceae bacterium]|nr:UbiA prenyltransferase family protein [Streptosporangiaceae bacterium]
MSAAGDYLTLSRLPVAIVTSVCFVLGGLAAPHHPLAALVVLGLAGILQQAFACHINDIADYEADRRNPGRRPSPLVTGAVTLPRITFWAVTESVILTCAAVAAVRPWPALAGFVIVIMMTAWVNSFQKTSRFVSPLVTDVIFGLAIALPLPLSAWALSGHLAPVPLWLGAAWMFQMVMMNTTTGNLKDLEHDRASGARTTALVLGVRQVAGRFVLTRRYLAFVLAAQGASVACLAAACAIAARSAVQQALAAAALLIALASTAGLARQLRPASQRPRGPAARSRLTGLPATWGHDAGPVLGNLVAFLLAAAASISASGVGWFALVIGGWTALVFAIRALRAVTPGRLA